MTERKRKSIDAALKALFREREQPQACDRLVAMMRALPPEQAAT
jgi:hypothetical protein